METSNPLKQAQYGISVLEYAKPGKLRPLRAKIKDHFEDYHQEQHHALLTLLACIESDLNGGPGGDTAKWYFDDTRTSTADAKKKKIQE